MMEHFAEWHNGTIVMCFSVCPVVWRMREILIQFLFIGDGDADWWWPRHCESTNPFHLAINILIRYARIGMRSLEPKGCRANAINNSIGIKLIPQSTQHTADNVPRLSRRNWISRIVNNCRKLNRHWYFQFEECTHVITVAPLRTRAPIILHPNKSNPLRCVSVCECERIRDCAICAILLLNRGREKNQ